ncbi:hypothetical protein AB1Y20_015682 [Prymnesium parvum]|uniref:MICOS complex subunit MIC60 n=1 Tax=Prymnesium parvum TaxID=97485 RepID=A0AB34JXG7_PRYPA
MLGKVLCRAAAHARLLTVSISHGTDEKLHPVTREDLRRFDTLPPSESDSWGKPDSSPPPPAEQQAEAAAQMLAEATTELTAKIARLRAELEARAAVDDEAWRVQQAVQRQEEADSMKMLALLREQDDAFAFQLSEATADVEAAVLRRMREEQAALEAEYVEAMQQMAQQHEAVLAEVRAAAEAEKEAAVAESVALAEARMQLELDTAVAEERARAGAKLAALDLEVSALAAVLSHDSQYKLTSHATHQLSATVLGIEESLTRRSMVPSAKALRALPTLAAALKDELLIEATAPLAGKGADRYAQVPTLAQLSKRFVDVASAGCTASLVPEGTGMWGYALAQVASLLTVGGSRGGSTPLNVSDTALIFSRASEALEQGALLEAVSEVRKLHGPPASAARGWLEAAEERLLLEQILTIAKAESAIAMAALS